ncbi:hypothetical protein AGMMS49965_15380 [Bacteroidia bacterium]|nr:hypothetical protein AGMMS49965_15380 [Bacteroidia bacterium]
MNIRNNTILSLVLVAFSGMFPACEDAEHYAEKGQSQTSLMGLISARPELSRFAELLRQTGYDAILDGEQVYTVWAPNDDALAGADLSDADKVAYLVSNHIARFSASASGSEERTVSMVNDKPLKFYRDGDNYYLRVASASTGAPLVNKNIAAKNGLLHVLGQDVPFVRNIWQYMAQPGFEPIKDYLYSFNRRTFMENQSTQIDVDGTGMNVYDSVFINSNEMFYPFRGIGYLNYEDSIYSMIMPTKEAWDEAYARVAPYFASNDPIDPDSVQRENTKYALIKDLVFFDDDLSQRNFSPSDTIFSTRGAAIGNPNHLFTDGEWKEASNGKVFVANKLNYTAGEAWQQPIIIEAEYALGRIFDPATEKGTLRMWWDTNDKDLSNGRYIIVSSTGPNDYPSVTFDIPNTVAGKYNIYCRLVPGTPRTEVRSRIVYEIYKWNKGTDIKDYIPGRATPSWRLLGNNDANGRLTTEPEDPACYEGMFGGAARADAATNMLLARNFQFKHANFNEENTSIRIRIISFVPPDWVANGTFRNVMRIDCIMLVPVE